MKKYEEFDHTADIGVIIHGASLEELFENAAFALFDLQVDLGGVRPAEERQIRIPADDIDQALVRWLQELLVLMEIEGLVFSRFNVMLASHEGVEGIAWGEALDLRRHILKAEIKAITYHGLKIEKETEEQGWKARIIFDV